jgi:IS5 family transposase
LAKSIDWVDLCHAIAKFYDPEIGRPSADLRQLISITMLQNIYNLSDESITLAWSQNMYFQAFSGSPVLVQDPPFNSSTLTNFRKKIGPGGLEIIFAESVRIHGLDCLEDTIIMDTTVQPKYTAFPTDTKLRLDVINQCFAMSDHLDIKFDFDYHDRVVELKKLVNFTKATKSETKKSIKEAAINELKDIANSLLDQLLAKTHPETRNDPNFMESMANYRKAVNQKKDDKDKIYSIFEPHIACIAKGKAHRKYEFGNKVSVAIGLERKVIVGIASLTGSPYDGDTVAPTLTMMSRVHDGYGPLEVIGDLGYRGRPEVLGTKVLTPSDLRGADDPTEREIMLSKLRKRSAIEPIIVHLKSDFGLNRNMLHGIAGDHINSISAAIGFNLRNLSTSMVAKI